MAAGTGHGLNAGIAFTTTGASFEPIIISIDGGDLSRPRLDTSHLATIGTRTQIPGDLKECGTWSVTCLCDPTLDAKTIVPFSAAETITITFGRTVAASVAGAKFVGSGFIVSRTYPSAQTDTVMTFTFDISWATEPTFTREA
jgi:hypothetical protein